MHPFKHFCTICRHRHEVFKIASKIGIGFQALFHDLSKFSPTEFIIGAKYYQGYRSPNVRERELFGYSKAWLHHKGRNKHHFEYWVDIIPGTNVYGPIEMPMRYLKEMFADRVAATKVYRGKDYQDGDALDYYIKKESGLKMHPKTAERLSEFLTMLKEKGEKETYKYIKSIPNK